MSELDQIESLRAVDKARMAEVLQEFPQRMEAVWREPLPHFAFEAAQVHSILIAGLGGSAIGGDITACAYARTATKPIVVSRGALLPQWAGRDTLVIAVSYSGNTSEVLAVYQEARTRGCQVVVVTSGGALASSAAQDHVPLVRVGGYPQPRLAVGDLALAISKIIGQMCGSVYDGEIREAIRALGELLTQIHPSVPTEENRAKHLAYMLLDRLPVIVGSGICAPIAYRWKTQMNENAKTLCVAESLPELLHNTIEGLNSPAYVSDECIWILLEGPVEDTLPSAQMDNFASLLQSKGLNVERVKAPSSHLFTAQWWLLYLGDWVSYYLACLHGVDPMPVPTIQGFKSHTKQNIQTSSNKQ